MESGQRPNSIRIGFSREQARELQAHGLDITPAGATGDWWVNYQLFQPFSVQLAAMGNAWERFRKSDRSDKAAEESLAAALSGAAASFLDQSFLSGVSGFLDAISDPERNATRVLSSFAQGLVPGSGLLRNITQAVDPTMRKPEGVVESMQAITPGLSSRLPARLGRFGQEIQRPGGPIRRGFLVPEVSEETSDPMSALLARVGVTPTVPRPPRIIVDGTPIKFTREQEQLIVKAIGLERQRRLQRILDVPQFERLSPVMQTRTVERAIREASEFVDTRVRIQMRRRQPLTRDLLASTADAPASAVGR
jgi:hypothetical protein